jgi:hypothetical protein
MKARNWPCSHTRDQTNSHPGTWHGKRQRSARAMPAVGLRRAQPELVDRRMMTPRRTGAAEGRAASTAGIPSVTVRDDGFRFSVMSRPGRVVAVVPRRSW